MLGTEGIVIEPCLPDRKTRFGARYGKGGSIRACGLSEQRAGPAVHVTVVASGA